MTFSWETTGKTPNGTPWPITHETHSKEQIDYAFRSPGSWTPDGVVYLNNQLMENLNRIKNDTSITDPVELMRARIAELGHAPGTLHADGHRS